MLGGSGRVPGGSWGFQGDPGGAHMRLLGEIFRPSRNQVTCGCGKLAMRGARITAASPCDTLCCVSLSSKLPMSAEQGREPCQGLGVRPGTPEGLWTPPRLWGLGWLSVGDVGVAQVPPAAPGDPSLQLLESFTLVLGQEGPRGSPASLRSLSHVPVPGAFPA